MIGMKNREKFISPKKKKTIDVTVSLSCDVILRLLDTLWSHCIEFEFEFEIFIHAI